ncbi:hypothetical protein NM688_g8838 [Phlebia brevispora]|uniref:Uncharacterized protein n=1 Tax=Phlebia brevispora TaxID=194682 RepID=A0ACC1RQ50_9APHY|nr:hypothetical protein NM688_g8838 [Phlebia brevispora]
MCHDGNGASFSSRYLNGQFANLWENAIECIRQCGATPDWQSEHYEKDAYTRALAQYHFFGKRSVRTINSTDDLLFHAAFGKPELKFICNHEAVLYLTIERGQLNLDYGKATAAEYQLDSAQTVNIENLQLAFRFPFSLNEIKGRDANKSSKHLIQLLVLDLASAKLALLRPDSGLNGAAKAALLFYMRKYLEFLQSGGYHTLYDLPDFEGKFKTKVDYSLHYQPIDLEILCAGVSVHGTNLQEVNTFLHRQWLIAASTDSPEDPLSICLAELNSSWLADAGAATKFHIRFGPPTATALCQNELLVCFDVEDIAFFDNDKSNADVAPTVYHNWKLAFVMDVLQETEDGKAVLRLDFQSVYLLTSPISP